ncbi:MAG: hypothetical protein JNM48_05650 [Rhodospirillales bacterium]|nr:hypothetical protein [Rhodospirillales bacterium]
MAAPGGSGSSRRPCNFDHQLAPAHPAAAAAIPTAIKGNAGNMMGELYGSPAVPVKPVRHPQR